MKLGSFIAGMGVGAVGALVFAPKSGEETREILKSKADEGKEFLRKQAADLRENASGLATDIVEKGREAIDRQKDSLNDAIRAGKQAYRDKVDGDGAGAGQPI